MACSARPVSRSSAYGYELTDGPSRGKQPLGPWHAVRVVPVAHAAARASDELLRHEHNYPTTPTSGFDLHMGFGDLRECELTVNAEAWPS
jgi:hypothetical protein